LSNESKKKISALVVVVVVVARLLDAVVVVVGLRVNPRIGSKYYPIASFLTTHHRHVSNYSLVSNH